MTTITESDVEEAALAWLAELDWQVAHGPDIAPETPSAERNDYGQVVLERRLQDALGELNPGLPSEALDDAFRKLTPTGGGDTGNTQPRVPPHAGRRRDDGASGRRRRDTRGAGEGHRF